MQLQGFIEFPPIYVALWCLFYIVPALLTSQRRADEAWPSGVLI